MKREMMPTRDELERHRKLIPEIDPSAVIAMLRIMRTGQQIQHAVLDVLQQEYGMSEGKFCAMVVMHQYKEGISPSALAGRVGVTRATISNMLQRLERDGMVLLRAADGDGRCKMAQLTDKGRALMQEVLPPHYLRVSQLMSRLSESEQREIIYLLQKLTGEKSDH